MGVSWKEYLTDDGNLDFRSCDLGNNLITASVAPKRGKWEWAVLAFDGKVLKRSPKLLDTREEAEKKALHAAARELGRAFMQVAEFLYPTKATKVTKESE